MSSNSSRSRRAVAESRSRSSSSSSTSIAVLLHALSGTLERCNELCPFSRCFVLQATLLHPFDLLATRMITESRAEVSSGYQPTKRPSHYTWTNGIWSHSRLCIFSNGDGTGTLSCHLCLHSELSLGLAKNISLSHTGMPGKYIHTHISYANTHKTM